VQVWLGLGTYKNLRKPELQSQIWIKIILTGKEKIAACQRAEVKVREKGGFKANTQIGL